MAADLKKLFKDWMAAWDSLDTEKISQFYTDDCIYDNVATGLAFHGKKEFIAGIKITFKDIPDFKVEIKTAFYSENAVCGEFTMSGTQAHSSNPAIPSSGKHFSLPVAFITEWQQDKLKRHTVYYDFRAFMQQLGLMPGVSPKK
jgi:steroid delta-isomerase-like uncharacterized protein